MLYQLSYLGAGRRRDADGRRLIGAGAGLVQSGRGGLLVVRPEPISSSRHLESAASFWHTAVPARQFGGDPCVCAVLSVFLVLIGFATLRPSAARRSPRICRMRPRIIPLWRRRSVSRRGTHGRAFTSGAGVSAWGGKGVKGGVGGDGYVGYDHAFDNGVVVGVRASSGYEPFLVATPSGFTQFTGTAFVGGEATVGYRMGQFTPYLIAGVDIARPTAFASGALSPLDAANAVFSGPGAVQAVGTVGMGFTYQVTPNFAFGVEGRMYRANNANSGLAPLPY